MHRKLQPFAEGHHELQIQIGLMTSKPMMHMNGRESDAKAIAR
jgi:hypothetical protein